MSRNDAGEPGKTDQLIDRQRQQVDRAGRFGMEQHAEAEHGGVAEPERQS